MTYMSMAYVVMAYEIMVHTVMAYIVLACMFMAPTGGGVDRCERLRLRLETPEGKGVPAPPTLRGTIVFFIWSFVLYHRGLIARGPLVDARRFRPTLFKGTDQRFFRGVRPTLFSGSSQHFVWSDLGGSNLFCPFFPPKRVTRDRAQRSTTNMPQLLCHD